MVINGISQPSALTDAHDLITSVDDFGFSFAGGGLQAFDGIIDEIVFWKRLLTNQEKQALYNNGNGYQFISPYAANIIC